MLLADSQIKRELEEGGLRIMPFIDPEKAIQPASIDLRLGRALKVVTANGSQDWDLIDHGPFVLTEHDFVLGATLEWFEIGPHLAGEIVGKSSLARAGLVVEAAGYFDPGWKGEGTVELSNRCPLPITLTIGMWICQLRLHPVAGEVERPYGSQGLGSHYQGSRGPKLAYMHDPAYGVGG